MHRCVSSAARAACVSAWLFASVTFAQYPTYTIHELGVPRPDLIGANGFNYTQINEIQADTQQVIGFTDWYPTGRYAGRGAWVWNPALGNTMRLGFTGPDHTGSTGYQSSNTMHMAPTGHVLGYSTRVAGEHDNNGNNLWVWDPASTAATLLGLTGPQYTGTSGYQNSTRIVMTDTALIVGTSDRISGVQSLNGTNSWVWSPVLGATAEIGLVGPDYTGLNGFQSVLAKEANASGVVIGSSRRFTAAGASNGEDAWVWSPALGTTVQTGLAGSDYTNLTGYHNSINDFVNPAGLIGGRNERVLDVPGSLGFNTWVWDPATQVSTKTGLTGPDHTGSAGFQSSTNLGSDGADLFIGTSRRVSGNSISNGQNTWVWTNATGTIQTGLTEPDHTGSQGYQKSDCTINAPGVITGTSQRIRFASTDNGTNTWVWDAATQTTIQTGLTGADHTGSLGFQFSEMNQYTAGMIFGSTRRITGINTDNGQNTWVWDPATKTTIQSGLTGPDHTGSAGFQSSVSFATPSGVIYGGSTRITGVDTSNGVNTWIWDPGAKSTVQTGLTGAEHTGSAGRQVSSNVSINTSGQVVGISNRYSGVDTYNGADTWVWSPALGATVQIGLTGLEHTGSAGFRYSDVDFLSNAGLVAGFTQRILGVDTFNGFNAWVWSQALGTTVPIGLTGPDQTDDNGYQASTIDALRPSGQVIGVSYRIDGNLEDRGNNTWVWSESLGTVQTGLTDADHTFTGGYQISTNFLEVMPSDVVVGTSERAFGDFYSGQDAWYFDPITGDTYQPTLGVPGAVRIADNYAHSFPQVITEDSFLLGSYEYFQDGLTSQGFRCFVFRPDLGFTDLGALVEGGLTAAGWASLGGIISAESLDVLIGHGTVFGGNENDVRLFAMTPVPAPGSIAIIGLASLGLVQRRRAA